MTENIAIDRVTARKTTLVVVAVLLVVGSWQVYRVRPTAATVFLGLAAVLAVVAFVPPLALLFHRGWMGLAGILGYINTRILLSVVFYGIFTPMAAWLRLLKHDPLSRRGKPHPSYWIPRTETHQTRAGFERAF